MNKIDVTKYTPKVADRFLFDNNIWMYLYCPIGGYNDHVSEKYSDFFGKILDVGAKIYVPSIILSEFYNSYVRLDFNIWRNKEEKDFKRDYRPLDRFKEISEVVINSIESRILGIAEKINDSFDEINLDQLTKNIGSLDFNDSLLVELATKNKLKLVTHDKDFLDANAEIDIVTLHS